MILDEAMGASSVNFSEAMRTNFPMLTPEACLKQIDMLELDEETKELFLSGNAKKVFKL